MIRQQWAQLEHLESRLLLSSLDLCPACPSQTVQLPLGQEQIAITAGWDIALVDGSLYEYEKLAQSLTGADRVVVYDGQNDSASDLLARVTELA
ncbi:MAG: hypothetical protein HQ546_00325, partial [Planctomycetes bacterium]|nr:hypothetical protein [Planctomycetota bacterium]